MINVTIDVNFDFSTTDIDKIVQQELNKSANQIKKQAKINCPVDTGRLKNSIETDIGDLEVDIGTSCEYAGYVHDGTYRMAARPFLDSAAETVLDDIEDSIADAIVRSLWLR